MSGLLTVPDPPPILYAVRILPRVTPEIDTAAARLEALSSEEHAREWRRGLVAEIIRLRTNPRRHPIVPEQALFTRATRQFVYRRPGSPGSSFAYRVLFTFQDEGPDGPVVKVFHVRHASAWPIRRKEAGELESSR